MKSIKAWYSDHKKMLWFIGFLSLAFYLFWSLNIGGLISFCSIFFWASEKLTNLHGVDPWLARSLLVPIIAVFLYFAKLMLSVTSREKRSIGTVMMVVFFCLLSFGMYLYTKDRLAGGDYFDRFTGEPLKRYSVAGGKLEIFPKNIKYHPATGEPLEILESKEYYRLINNEGIFMVRANVIWNKTNYLVDRGDKITITAYGNIKLHGDKKFSAGPGGYPISGTGASQFRELTVFRFEGIGGLIARIGEHGKPFYVGAISEFEAEESGILHLGVNHSDCSKNEGTFEVHVASEKYDGISDVFESQPPVKFHK